MKSLQMNELATDRRLDNMSQGLIGKPLDRADGPLKVSGQATYAHEWDIEGLVHGVLVGAPIGCGTITGVQKADVLKMDGVLAVIDDERLLRNPAQGTANEAPVQGCKTVAYFGQPIALVVAETFEQARYGAHHLEFSFNEVAGVYSTDAASETEKPEGKQLDQGDLDQALKDAAFRVESHYTTPGHNSAAMEPHASIAQWDGDQLTLRSSLQMLKYNRNEVADSLGIHPEKVRLLSPYVGGGFGSKLGIAPETIAASIAAKALGKPVSVTMTRPQVFQTTMRRSESQQTIRLAADKDGKLIGIGHEYLVSSLMDEGFSEPVGQATHFTYPGQNRRLVHEVARVNKTCAGSVRAPGESIGVTIFEIAMDELAQEVGIDPVELRLRNIPEKHPESGIPYSSRNFEKVLKRGASEFGWEKRHKKPKSQMDGEWYVGMGMATAVRVNMIGESEAQVTLNSDGTLLIETDMTDIGTGTYTILAQIAGEMLGIPTNNITTNLGDTNNPPSAGSGGSWGAGSAGSSIYLACEDIRKKLCEITGTVDTETTFKDGLVSNQDKSWKLIDLLDGTPVTAKGKIAPGATSEDMHQASYGTHFAEVAVNCVTGETRVRRMLGVFSAGRILNEKTARSQCYGGMVWGIGMALTEELIHDARDGHIVNSNLAEYHIPVNLDVPQIDVIFLEERDDAANPMQSKGIGELGICGAGASVINAIYNACGVRVRDLPATLDKIIDKIDLEESDAT
jgi:xanthine dehydrogenase YagR molybdenum-binding subunit